MKENLTEIIFILDRSGSMCTLEADTIGGYNTFIEKQKNEEGEARLTTVLFDDQYEILHDGVDLKAVAPLTKTVYFARGSTSLLDAIGKTINSVGNRLNAIEEEERPSKVIFVITTDGHENTSREFTQPQIKEMITHQTDKYNWQFMFLGANIDAVKTASSFGISGQYASTYSANSAGTDSMYSTLNNTVAFYRSTGEIDKDWSKTVK